MGSGNIPCDLRGAGEPVRDRPGTQGAVARLALREREQRADCEDSGFRARLVAVVEPNSAI